MSCDGCAGDKPQAFVGSRDWIGAIELGYVLDTKLGLTCKVMTVSSGAEMGSKARELAQHFDAQGTPVMVSVTHIDLVTLPGLIYSTVSCQVDHHLLQPNADRLAAVRFTIRL